MTEKILSLIPFACHILFRVLAGKHEAWEPRSSRSSSTSSRVEVGLPVRVSDPTVSRVMAVAVAAAVRTCSDHLIHQAVIGTDIAIKIHALIGWHK